MTAVVCSVNDCDRVVVGRGLCSMHYARLIRTGDIHRGRGPNLVAAQKEHKVCTGCLYEKPLTDFHRSGRQRVSTCKECRSVAMRQDYAVNREREVEKKRRYREANREAILARRRAAETPEHHRAARLHRLYGLTIEDYDALLVLQDGACAVCQSTDSASPGAFHVDHCHVTGAVRGLLCGRCNVSIGMAGDDPERLEAAAQYLRRHELPAEQVLCQQVDADAGAHRDPHLRDPDVPRVHPPRDEAHTDEYGDSGQDAHPSLLPQQTR